MTQQPQNGQPVPAPELPASLRTHLLMGGALYHVDQEVDEVLSELEAFLLGSKRFLVLRADGRPIAFSRRLMEEALQVVWARDAGPRRVVPVTEPAVVRQLDRR